MTREIAISGRKLGNRNPLFVIAGPCVIESEDIALHTAERLKEICGRTGLPLLFKSSYDKANRTSVSSFRGPGLEKGMRVLSDVKSRLNIPVISDVHSVEEVRPASNTGRPVNIKKGQFLSPWDVKNVIDKFISTGNRNLFITERGVSFGYNNLVVDFRGLPVMRAFGYPVIFDVTHSLQLPGGMGKSSGGQREFAGPLARAAVAVGVDGLFMEVHPEPGKALCDGPNMIKLDEVEMLLRNLKTIDESVRNLPESPI